MMKRITTILALSFAILSVFAQNKWEVVRPKNIPWGKVALSFGASLTAIGLEMSGDALYDMGKEAGNNNQMQLGHTLQAMGNASPFVTVTVLSYINRHQETEWWKELLFNTGTYVGLRFAAADLYYNSVYGLPPLYAGTTSTADNYMSKIPPDGRVALKGFTFTVVFVMNISYLEKDKPSRKKQSMCYY
jgi:hypothetical protein